MNDAQSAGPSLILTENRLLRLAAVALFYFTQGIPQGFFFVALPAWLATQGASAAEIATVISITVIPNSIKFLNGFLMDRYTYLAMGRRRAWIIGAQFCLVGALLAGMVLSPGSKDILLLAGLGFVASLSYAFQDVGIDSLAIDIMEDDERAKAASLMFGSAIIGMAFMTWLGGLMLDSFGASAAFGAAAIAPAAVMLFGVLVKERRGEKRFPWSAGAAHPRNLSIQVGSWLPLLKNAFKALFAPASLILLVVLISRNVPQGVADTLHPLIATRAAGWELTEYTNLLTAVQLVAGVMTLVVYGVVVDRMGHQRALAAGAGMVVILFSSMIALSSLWGDARVLTAYLFAYELILMFLIVAIIPIVMRICTPIVAATQFAIYMAASNVGRPIGALVTGYLGEGAAITLFGMIVVIYIGVALIAIFYRFPDNMGEVEPVEDLAPEASMAG